MRVVKYICYGLGILLSLSNFGAMMGGLFTPILWFFMAIFFITGAVIKVNK